MKDTLTYADFEEMLDALYPVLYYATDANLERGKLYYVKEGDLHPEFIVCHPEDFELVKVKLTARRLVHIKDEPPNKARSRLVATLRKKYPALEFPSSVNIEPE